MRTGQPKNPTPKPVTFEARLKKALRSTYEINSLLGTGGMGNVYLATHKQLGSKVAIKVLSEDLSSDALIVGRFLNEAKIEANLQHPNIVRVFDVRKHGGLHYFVMDYVEGEDLAERMDRSRCAFPTLEAINVGLQILKALSHAHENNIIHRDLKPSNVRIDRHGTAIVMDFGIAHARNASENCKTILGQTLGTPLYMSPEQIKGLPLDNRSDLYSLGVILHEMLAGSNFFAGESVHAIYSKHLYEVPPNLSRLRSDISPRLSAVVEKVLAKDADARYRNATEMMEELQSIGDNTVPIALTSCHTTGQLSGPRAQSAVPPTIAFLADEDRRLLDLIDGRRTVAQLQQLSQLETQDLYRRLVTLEKQKATKAQVEIAADVQAERAATPGADTNPERFGWLSEARERVRTILLSKTHLSRTAWLSLVGIGVVLCLVTVFVLTPGDSAPAAEASVTRFDAAPFALVTLTTSGGQVVTKQETPFSLALVPGKYAARFEFAGEERVQQIEVRQGRQDLFREQFWSPEKIRQLLDRYRSR